jgi:DNA-directed RNA polymerase subunit RPC12/RpoP
VHICELSIDYAAADESPAAGGIMVAGLKCTCTHCGTSHEARDEGNPYIRDPLSRRKRYVYHPDPLRSMADGVDVPYLCLDCGKTFLVDSRKPRRACPTCRSRMIIAQRQLEGRRCPHCKQGHFAAVATMIA